METKVLMSLLTWLMQSVRYDLLVNHIYMFLSFIQGLVNIDTLRDAVSRLFMVRMKLGEFDPPEMNPYTK